MNEKASASVSSSTPKPVDTSAYDLCIVYDGECPFCRSYVQYTRLSSNFTKVKLINAREDEATRKAMNEKGLDLDKGMALLMGNKIYFGHEAINRLALLSTRSSTFSRINYALFRSPVLSRVLYPVLATGRRLVLLLRGVPPIS